MSDMETDPDEPGYRYPRPGERLWHVPMGRWVIVDDVDVMQRVQCIHDDEVPVRYEDKDQRAHVKLRSLEAAP